MVGKASPIIPRFMKHVQKTDSCWLWSAYCNKAGYGMFMAKGFDEKAKARPYLAHRISYVMHIGRIPAGICVCHKCDNPKCVNPNHLFLGTVQDNMNDKVAKGRVKTQFKSSITDEQKRLIVEYYSSGIRIYEIAKMMGINRNPIRYYIGRCFT